MEAVEIECGPCVIRTYRASDAEFITPLLNDRDVWLNLSDRVPHPYTVDNAKEFIALQLTLETPRNLAITVDGRAVGSVGVIPEEGIARVSAEIGYWLGKPYWGRGIASAAVTAMTSYAFSRFDFTRLCAWIFTHNDGSRRVLEKCGYVREGHTRQAVIKDGVIHDEYLYATYKPR
jgi:ribosomal-protein-alanine N-acetyltransferase